MIGWLHMGSFKMFLYRGECFGFFKAEEKLEVWRAGGALLHLAAERECLHGVLAVVVQLLCRLLWVV